MSMNRVFNTLKITGKVQDLPLDPESPSISKLFPPPEGWEGETLQDWCLRYWGCYEILEEYLQEQSEDRIVFQIVSTWDAPHKLVQKLSEMYPDLKFVLDYQDEYENFSGTFRFAAGEVLYHHDNLYDQVESELAEMAWEDPEGFKEYLKAYFSLLLGVEEM